ncbi:MAG: amino acid permease [Deltaproteobacteria bacterium]|nr:amino acid permease [Deltaproteobacteria bacterium]
MPGVAGLKRQLGWFDAAALYVGIILGSGIFVAPAAVAQAAPALGSAAGMWLLGAFIAGCGAFCYAECGARLPRTGGFYVFYRETYGDTVAFVGGWAALLITYPASVAAIALIFARYLAQIIPQAEWEAGVAAAAVVASGLLNVVGVRVGAWAQRLLTATKVIALAVLCLAALLAPVSAAPLAAATPAGLTMDLGVLTAALVVMLWTYDGWSDVTLVAGEIDNPGRNLGRAVLVGTLTLAALYLLVQMAVLVLLPADAAAGSKQVVADAVRAGLGTAAGRMVAVLVVVSTFGSLHGVIFTASRLGFAMANEGAFLPWLAAVHPRFGTPARSTAALVAATLVFVFVATFQNLLGLFSFNVWIFYGTSAVALLVLRRRGVGEPVTWRAPGGALAPLVVVATALCMTVGLLVQSPLRSVMGLGLLAAGLPVYAVWTLARRRLKAPR